MTTKTSNPVESTAEREIIATRVFDAPRELLWELWTDPRHVVKWWGPRGFTTTILKMEVRPGGVWQHVMRGPDGTDYPNRSIFKEVVKPERIVYSHGGGRKGGPGARFEATWTFDALEDGKTKVTIRMIFPSAAARDKVVKEYGAIEGAHQTLARLGEETAKAPVIVEQTLNAPVETVWKAITDKDQMKQWYFESLDSFRPETGFQTQFKVRNGDKEYLHIWKVAFVVTGKKIAYSWKYGGYPGNSLVKFELFADGGKTRIKLTHAGLETFLPESNPALARGNFVKGWTHFAAALKEFLE